jgi:hypothetical protein
MGSGAGEEPLIATPGLCVRVVEQKHPPADAAAQPNDDKQVSHENSSCA